jgi:hypothetical protein
MARAREPLKDRICRTHRKVGACWVWAGSYGKDGYGVMTVGRKQVRAHRASWEAFKGQGIPERMVVRHLCDNPACVNPAHLELGTHKQNTADMDARGRRGTATDHPLWRLSHEDRETIRALRADGQTLTTIADRYGIAFQTVSEICLRKGAYAS